MWYILVNTESVKNFIDGYDKSGPAPLFMGKIDELLQVQIERFERLLIIMIRSKETRVMSFHIRDTSKDMTVQEILHKQHQKVTCVSFQIRQNDQFNSIFLIQKVVKSSIPVLVKR
eukprot:TRINITY_DN8295_c0_g1_i2.p1 TRINITY_DN8295_c0_g1~~TRINITY_DN8295_c0_g1_i2.p1  ORF type:complete len:116 (+),score=17.30 TRINITY_DN8295_c0_g1_i2:238-585(+)